MRRGSENDPTVGYLSSIRSGVLKSLGRKVSKINQYDVPFPSSHFLSPHRGGYRRYLEILNSETRFSLERERRTFTLARRDSRSPVGVLFPKDQRTGNEGLQSFFSL